jgi:hypothetical protein
MLHNSPQTLCVPIKISIPFKGNLKLVYLFNQLTQKHTYVYWCNEKLHLHFEGLKQTNLRYFIAFENVAKAKSKYFITSVENAKNYFADNFKEDQKDDKHEITLEETKLEPLFEYTDIDHVIVGINKYVLQNDYFVEERDKSEVTPARKKTYFEGTLMRLHKHYPQVNLNGIILKTNGKTVIPKEIIYACLNANKDNFCNYMRSINEDFDPQCYVNVPDYLNLCSLPKKESQLHKAKIDYITWPFNIASPMFINPTNVVKPSPVFTQTSNRQNEARSLPARGQFFSRDTVVNMDGNNSENNNNNSVTSSISSTSSSFINNNNIFTNKRFAESHAGEVKRGKLFDTNGAFMQGEPVRPVEMPGSEFLQNLNLKKAIKADKIDSSHYIQGRIDSCLAAIKREGIKSSYYGTAGKETVCLEVSKEVYTTFQILLHYGKENKNIVKDRTGFLHVFLQDDNRIGSYTLIFNQAKFLSWIGMELAALMAIGAEKTQEEAAQNRTDYRNPM